MASPRAGDDETLSSQVTVLNLRPLSALRRPKKRRSSRVMSTSTVTDSGAGFSNPEMIITSSELQDTTLINRLQALLRRVIPSRVTAPAAQKLFLKMLIAFCVIPGIMAFIGYIVERIVYGGGSNSTNFHHIAMTLSGLIAAPFILVRWSWQWPKHLVKLEMLFYLTHTSIILATILTTMIDGSTAHFIADQIRDIYADDQYLSIKTSDDIYVYLENLMRRLYDNTGINYGSLYPLPGQLLLGGTIRLKQSRAKRKACSASLTQLNVNVTTLPCYAQYSKEDEEREPYGNGIRFNFSNPSFKNYAGVNIKMSDIFTVGQLSSYPIAGYWVMFGESFLQREALAIVDSIKNASWIDEQTRQISLDFAIVTKDLPRPVSSKVVLTIEKSVAGKFLPMNPLISFSYAEYVLASESFGENVCPEVTTQRAFLLPIYLGVLPVAIYTLFSLLYQLYISWRDLCSSIYAYVDGMWVIVVILVLVFRWQSIYFAHCNMIRFLQPLWPSEQVALVINNEVLPMGANWHRARQMLCIALFLYIFNSLKFITKVMTFDTIGKTLAYAIGNLASFAISFSVIFLAFAVMFYLLFSAADENYRSFTRSIGTVWMALLGNIDINNNLLISQELYLPLLLIFSFFLAFVLLTVVIAIVTDAFEKTKCEHRETRCKSTNRWQAVAAMVRQRRLSIAAMSRRTSSADCSCRRKQALTKARKWMKRNGTVQS